MKTEFNYVLLRYFHDVATGEFVNVGVVLVAPKTRFVGALCTSRYQRISHFFQGVSGKHYREVTSYVQGRIEEISERLSSGNLFDSDFPIKADQLAREVLPADDSSFQISDLRGGIAEASKMDAVLEELLTRFVERYERAQDRRSRTDEDVWRKFKRALDEKRLSAHLQPHLLRSPHCEFEFKKAFRNGRLHVCQPISFDLTSDEMVSDKALLWFGRIQQLGEGQQPFKAYFLLGRPSDPALDGAFKNAQDILREVGVDKELYGEDEADKFSEKINEELRSAHW